MSDQYIPSTEAIEWYRERFDAALTKIEEKVDRYEADAEVKSGMEKVLRLIRYDLLRPLDGCVITMFDPRMRTILELTADNG